MKISFVIPAYNEEAYLKSCLNALHAEIDLNGAGVEYEIIVVDNASTDSTKSVAQSFAGVHVVHEPIKGLARAKQTGLEQSQGDIIAFLDADTMPLSGWLTTIRTTFTDHADVVCVSGPYYYYDFPWFWRKVSWPYEIVFGGLAHALTGQCIAGGNMAVRRNAMLKIGGFNKEILFYGEDLDVGMRLKKVGKLVFTPRLGVASSARRFNIDGVIKTTFLYAGNFLSQAIRKRPITISHKDIR